MAELTCNVTDNFSLQLLQGYLNLKQGQFG